VEPHISHAASRAAYGGRAEFEITRVFLVGNTGTYLDSPYHRHRGAPDVAGLPLAAVAALPGVRLDAALGEDGRTIGLDLDAAGADDGALAGRAVLVRTGWDARRGSPGYWAPGPFVPAGLARRLVAADVALVGVDCWNIDDPGDPTRPAHTELLGAGIPIVEHLAGLDRLPLGGFRFHAAPVAVRGAASFPVRAYAEVPRRRSGQAGWTPAARNVRR
jgi:kynurenine formamidase